MKSMKTLLVVLALSMPTTALANGSATTKVSRETVATQARPNSEIVNGPMLIFAVVLMSFTAAMSY